MANVELKIDFKDGDILFSEQLNNNFKAIVAALKAANKISWQDDIDTSLTVFKGTTKQVNGRGIIDGQLVYDIEKGEAYIDIVNPLLEPEGEQRINISGGVKTVVKTDLSTIIDPGVYLVKTGNNNTDELGTGDSIQDFLEHDCLLIVGKENDFQNKIYQKLEYGNAHAFRTIEIATSYGDTIVSDWDSRVIGDTVYIGEEVPTDDSVLWINPTEEDPVYDLLKVLYPIGKVEIFFDNEDHSNHLGFKWERIQSYEAMAFWKRVE